MLLWGTLASLVLLAACAEETQGCPAPICDVRRPDCQAALWSAAKCGRGVEAGAIPPIRVIDAATFRAELEARGNDAMPDPGSEHWGTGLQLLGLIPASVPFEEQDIADAATTIAAFYSTEDGSIALVDRGEAPDEAGAVLVHEMVHAIQDRRYGLAEFLSSARDFDERSARLGLVEGDALLHQSAYLLETRAMPRETVNWRRSDPIGALEMIPSGSPWNLGSRVLLYLLGLRFVIGRWEPVTSSDDLDVLFDDPPTSIRAFVASPPHPDTREELACDPSPPPSHSVVVADRFGAAMVFAFFRELDLPTAAEVTGDSMVVVGDSTGTSTAVVWRIRLASASTAMALRMRAEAIWESRDGQERVALESDRDLLLFAANNLDVFDAWMPTATAPCD